MRLALNDLIDGLTHTEPSQQDRAAAPREIKAIRLRLDRLTDALL